MDRIGGWMDVDVRPILQHELLNGTSELLSTDSDMVYLVDTLDLGVPTTGRDLWIGVLSGVLLMSSAYNPFSCAHPTEFTHS